MRKFSLHYNRQSAISQVQLWPQLAWVALSALHQPYSQTCMHDNVYTAMVKNIIL